MARLFAIADLHLSGSGAKPMDVFGEIWRDHASRMAAAWDAVVGPSDEVLVAGDLSWGRTLDEARDDLAWIGARPGRKYLLRGNHDSWWSSPSAVRRVLPDGCEILQNEAFELSGCVLVGARGWLAPDDPAAGPADAPIFRRELSRLSASIEDADRRFGRARPRVAMLHYPPWIEGRPPTDVVGLLRDGGVGTCVYGHLHGADHAMAVRGVRDGIAYYLVAADAVAFTPVPIDVVT